MNVGNPSLVIGDMVTIINGILPVTEDLGMVIAARPSDQVPDLKTRGLADVYPWRYWVLRGSEVLGPLAAYWLERVD